MPFLSELTFRRLATGAPRFSAIAVAPRVTATSTLHSRHLSSSAPRAKTVTETAKDTLKSVDRAVSDKLVDGINVGSAMANKVKEAGQDIADGKATGKAQQLRNEAEATGNELKRDAEVKGQGFKEAAKDKASQAAEKTKQAAGEVKSRM
ncbi:hypothetical protein SCUCBS95973_003514 [Sporothrix curviconia]|uniref:Lea domain containing protein n=1 Tax=Sporothrix curviconia TaxID=1260050 RepID=A0ABP0BFV9_9PEZI